MRKSHALPASEMSFPCLSLTWIAFKSYNDIHGHLYGDNILRKVGEVIKNNSRAIDVAARYGGDEFSVILPQTSIDSAIRVAERLRNAMESEVNNKGMTVTCSIGVASWPTDGVMKEDLIHAADTALYHAKKWGGIGFVRLPNWRHWIFLKKNRYKITIAWY